MERDVVMVLTGKTKDDMLSEGGAGHWRVRASNIQRCRYAVTVRNRRAAWGKGKEEHGAAFLIGRITGLMPSPTRPGRSIIKFDSYALLNLPKVWRGNRFPIAYTTLENLGIEPDKLEWKPFRESKSRGSEKLPLLAVLEKAKTDIADALGLEASAIEITVRV